MHISKDIVKTDYTDNFSFYSNHWIPKLLFMHLADDYIIFQIRTIKFPRVF